jgi:hypothetical protein
LDTAEPPRIVWESPGQCADAERAEEVLRGSLSSARAPGQAWVVNVHVEPASGHAVRAEGEISDAQGSPIAHRILSGVAGECESLARAMGVWASLVLDLELTRVRSRALQEPLPSTQDPIATTATPAVADSQPTVDSQPVVMWPAPAILEKPLPEHDWYLHHEGDRTLEIGLGTFFMTGTGADAVAGGTAFLVAEADKGLFLRPSVAVGQSVTSPASSGLDVHATFAAARMDGCLRLPGLYTQQRGIQLDTCAGADLGFTHFEAAPPTSGSPAKAEDLPYLSIGPSLELRGELGGNLATSLRGMIGGNLIRGGFNDASGTRIQTPPLSGRIELSLSWRLR